MMLQMQPASCGKKASRSEPLKLSTGQFGTIVIEAEKIITMRNDLPGFPNRRRFILLEQASTRPFYWFQSIDDPQLALSIINPYLFVKDYNVDLKNVLKEMAWDNDERKHIKIYVVVNAANRKPEKITANLIGPLLINILRYEAVQLVLYDSPYSHRYPLFGR